MTEVQLTARSTDLTGLVQVLEAQNAAKLDVVVPATAITVRDGNVVVKGAEAQVSDEGVTSVDGTYRPTDVFTEGAAAKLGIPRGYLQRCQREAPDLFDANLRGWLHGRVKMNGHGERTVTRQPDPRNFLLRLFRDGDGGTGVARAMLSDSYKLTMDNLDLLMAALEGIKQAGVSAQVTKADLSERKMHIRVQAPEVSMLAEGLLKDYRSPYRRDGETSPVVFAGLDILTSETGQSAFNIAPVVGVLACDNGLVVWSERIRKVHIGAKLDEGVQMSRNTQRKGLDFYAGLTADAVRTFLDRDFLAQMVASLERKAGVPVADAAKAIEDVTKALSYGETDRAAILDAFIRGGQMTSGGILQAFTAAAQNVADPDHAFQMEVDGIAAMERAWQSLP